MLIVLIVILGLAPPLLSLLVMRQLNQRTTQQLRAVMQRSAERRFAIGLPSGRSPERASSGASHPADHRYVEGIGYMIGDLTCQFNARSSYLRCAVNPMGDCKLCAQYQARPIADD